MTSRPMLFLSSRGRPFRVGANRMILVTEIAVVRGIEGSITGRIVPTLFHRVDTPAPAYGGEAVDTIIRAVIGVTEHTP